MACKTLYTLKNDLFRFIDNVPDAIVITDIEGKIVLINPQTVKIFGYSQEELIGEPVEKLMPDRFCESHKKHYKNYSNNPTIRPMGYGISIVGKCKDGNEVPLDISLSPYKNGNEVFVISYIRDISERMRIENRLRTSKELEILYNVTDAVHRSIVLDDVYNVATDMAVELENVDMAFIYLVDTYRNEAVLQAHRNLPEDYIRRARRIPYPEGATWQVINTGKQLNIENVQTDPTIGSAGRDLGHHSALGIPITSEVEVLGVIWFFSYKERRFEDEDIVLLTSLGNHIAIAIVKAKLYQNLSRISKYEKIKRTVIQNVHSSLDLQEVLENAAGSLIENIDIIDNLGIYMVEGENAILKAHRNLSDSFVEQVAIIPCPKGFSWKTILTGEPRYCADTEKDEFIGAAGKKEGIKSYLSMPIAFEGKTVGCININSKKKNAFDEEELKLLELISHQISIAIKHARQAETIRESEERYRSLYDQSPIGVCLIDRDLKITHCNKSMIQIFQSSYEKVIGLDLRTLRDRVFVPVVEEAFKGTISALEAPYSATTSPAKIWLSVQTIPLLDKDNFVHSVMGVVEDITERKRSEEELLTTQKLESVGILAGGIAHDLNNMLTPIIMSLQLLRNKFKDDKSLKWIDTIEMCATRGAGLIQQILLFSRGDGGEKAPLQLSFLLSEISKILQDTIPKSIEVNIGKSNDLWNIMGESTRLQQVLMNLCLNARDAMPTGGMLNISAENLHLDQNYAQIHIDANTGPYVVITVSDTGTGIAPEIIDRMFEPFFTTKDPGLGTGLGLSTVYRIIKDYEGFITVQSKEGVGTEFKLYLPAIETSNVIHAKSDCDKDTPLGNGELVLVVDDELAVLDITKLTLEAFGYKVITANDGAEAVGVYASNKNDIKAVILDMMMPIMDGSATIRALKKLDPDVKIIAVSGLIDTKEILTTHNLTVEAFLNKPYTSNTLMKTLYEVV